MIVFDLDGTLVDSAPEIVAAMEASWHEVVGGPFPTAAFRIGPPLLAIVRALGPELDAAQQERIAAAFRARYDASDFDRTVPYAGVREALEELAGRGERLAVATNKRWAPTRLILARRFPGRFPHVACVDGVSPDDGTRPGDKPAMLRWLMRALPAERVILVGDTSGDVAAARAVGARAVAVTWGYEASASLSAARPDALVHDVPSLLAALRSA
jgi:phosphoglycolate phosphatase